MLKTDVLTNNINLANINTKKAIWTSNNDKFNMKDING